MESRRRRALAMIAAFLAALVMTPAAIATGVEGGLAPNSATAAAVAPAAIPAMSSPMFGFDPTFIISDAVMDNEGTMSAEAVQTFLATRGSACVQGTDGSPCLKNAVFDTPVRSATEFCGAMTASTGESASSIIYRVSQACGINPQVLLVMLQKEQGLVTSVNPTALNYLKAMGFRCPDFLTCEPQYAGFSNQVYFAASRLNEYRLYPGRFSYQVGGTYNIALHPDTSLNCGTWRLTMRSAATAALYNYTPFTPNVAALDNYNGTGDECSAYGNRNFYRNFNTWFGRPNADGSAIGESRFLDVTAATTGFVTEIQWLGTSGISNGWSDGTFRHHAPATRGEFAAFLYRVSSST